MTGDDDRLGELFQRYASACPDIEPSVNFMPRLWQKIEVRHSVGSVFERLARTGMAAAAALCLLLLVLNLVFAPRPSAVQTYTDALMADHSAERTYYTEAIRSAPSRDEAPAELRRH
jgi:hypothetical protein